MNITVSCDEDKILTLLTEKMIVFVNCKKITNQSEILLESSLILSIIDLFIFIYQFIDNLNRRIRIEKSQLIRFD